VPPLGCGGREHDHARPGVPAVDHAGAADDELRLRGIDRGAVQVHRPPVLHTEEERALVDPHRRLDAGHRERGAVEGSRDPVALAGGELEHTDLDVDGLHDG